MSRLLVHLATGPENPTRAALALLVARSARSAGHDVDLFLAGDAVQLFRDATMDATHGIGTGSLREHFDALTASGARFFASGASSKARGSRSHAIPPTRARLCRTVAVGSAPTCRSRRSMNGKSERWAISAKVDDGACGSSRKSRISRCTPGRGLCVNTSTSGR